MAVDRDLVLRGSNHVLRGIPVDGDKWVGMISVSSPASDAAMLTVRDAELLIEWLQAMIAEMPKPCPCGHGEIMHDGDECMICDTCEA